MGHITTREKALTAAEEQRDKSTGQPRFESSREKTESAIKISIFPS